MVKNFHPSWQVISKYRAWTGWTILIFLSQPAIRNLLEADMRWHMLLQFPLLISAGMLIGASLPKKLTERLIAWNHHGISGLALATCVLTFWMIPRALDEVLVVPWLDALKFVSLTAGVGSALVLSWRTAGFIIQGFFIGNVLPMMAVVGWLYVESPVRLCNAYLLNQQEITGKALIQFSVIAAIAWMTSFFIQAKPLHQNR